MTTALADIILAIRVRADIKNNQLVSDTDITTMVNQSLCQLDMILISKYSDYKLTSAILTASAVDGSIALPSDFLKLRGVDVQYNANDPDGYIEIHEYSFQHRNRKPYMAQGSSGFGPNSLAYRLQGAKIIVAPVAQATRWPFRIWYTPDYVPLSATTDPLQPYMDSQGWYEYAVVDCCIKILAKQDLDPATFMAQKAEISALIMSLSAPNRNASEPKAMVDSRDFGDVGGYGYNW